MLASFKLHLIAQTIPSLLFFPQVRQCTLIAVTDDRGTTTINKGTCREDLVNY